MLRKAISSKVAALFTLLLVAGFCSASEPIYLGSVAMDVPTEMINRLAPVADYLSRQTGLNIEFKPSANLGNAVDDLSSGVTSLAYLTPAAYISAREKIGAIPVAAPLTKGKKTFTLIVAVAVDSPIRDCKDLPGKSFAFGDKKAYVQPGVLTECMGDLSKLGRVDYLNHYDNISKAVINGDFDAGIIKDTIFDEYAPKGLRKIYESRELAGYIIAASPQLSAESRDKITKALLSISSNETGQKTLIGLDKGYTGFSKVSDSEYDSLRQLIKKVKATK